MKLDVKKTIRVGFAFAIIMAFWTAYDFVVPLLLENAFGLSHTMRGLIMGLDNLLSLFLLPVFGKISDKTKTKWGKRTPFIFIGTIISCILMIFVPISAQRALKDGTALREQITNTEVENYSYTSSDGTVFESKTAIYEFLYDKGSENSDYADHEYMKKSGITTKEHYLRIAKNPYTVFENENDLVGKDSVDKKGNKVVSSDYKNFVQAGINNYASDEVGQAAKTNHKASLAIYMIILLLVLISMAVFRSPAVALMPDVTPKPLRSQANAIINLAGGVGGAISFLIYTVTLMINPTGFIAIFVAVACAMALLLVGFMLLVNEKKMLKECAEICAEYGITDNDEEEELVKADGTLVSEAAADPEKLKRAKFVSFILILASIFMWFMGYNAIVSTLSIFLTKTLLVSPGWASIVSGISMGISAIAFIPVGMLAVKIGRRKSIILGFALAVLSFFLIFLFASAPGSASVYLFTVFYLIAGFGLIIANVNTFPMVVELSSSQDIGKYTGLYYTATMSAQAITPFIAGLFMDKFGSKYLFLYSLVCVIVAIILMFFVKHGDSKPLPKKKKGEEDLELAAATGAGNVVISAEGEDKNE